jgi:hypothetical protein
MYSIYTSRLKINFKYSSPSQKILRTKYYLQPRYNLHNYHIGLVVCFNFSYHIYCNFHACKKYICPEADKAKTTFKTTFAIGLHMSIQEPSKQRRHLNPPLKRADF